MTIFSDNCLPFIEGETPTEIAIIDLDNCISDDRWRWPMFRLDEVLPNDRYAKYHEACESDLYQNGPAIRLLLRRKLKLVVFTSRPECVRIKTQRWINRWRIPVRGIFMRPDDNHDPSTVLKRAMLRSLPNHLRPVIAIDDRDDILNMYVEEGVPSIHKVIIHQPEHNHP